ncbi:MAG: type II secretion system protein GspG [Planctomycetaceae bacterium]|nr:type II secretion system protein GspG [Planctomycetaceae bacterium]
MSTWFYYDSNGQKQGPVSGGQLKGLAKAGMISPETIIETDEGKKATAGKVKGLTFVEPVQHQVAPSQPRAVQSAPHGAAPPPPAEDNPWDWGIPASEISSIVAESHASPFPPMTPTAQPAQAVPPSKKVSRAASGYDYGHIALLHQLSTVSILLIILAGVINAATGRMSGELMNGLLGLGLFTFGIVCAVRLANAIHYGVGAIVFFALCIFPGTAVLLPALVPLFCVYVRAGSILKKGGYKVGFVGANMRQFGESNAVVSWAALIGIVAVLAFNGIGWVISSPSGTKIPANFDYGNWTGSTYRNDFFDFSITVPGSWHIAGRGEIEAMKRDGMDADFINKTEMKRMAKVAEITTADLFFAQRYTDEEAEAREAFNPNISMAVENLAGMKISRAQYVEISRKNLVKIVPGIAVKSEKNRTIGGMEFTSVETEFDVYGVRVHQEYLMCLKNGFGLTLALSWGEASEKKLLDDIVATLSWNQGGQNQIIPNTPPQNVPNQPDVVSPATRSDTNAQTGQPPTPPATRPTPGNTPPQNPFASPRPEATPQAGQPPAPRTPNAAFVLSQRRQTQMRLQPISSAVERYNRDVGQFPTAQQGLAALSSRPVGLPASANWRGPYVSADIEWYHVDFWGNPYQYARPGKNGRPFDIWSLGPDGISGTADDVGHWMDRNDIR